MERAKNLCIYEDGRKEPAVIFDFDESSTRLSQTKNSIHLLAARTYPKTKSFNLLPQTRSNLTSAHPNDESSSSCRNSVTEGDQREREGEREGEEKRESRLREASASRLHGEMHTRGGGGV